MVFCLSQSAQAQNQTWAQLGVGYNGICNVETTAARRGFLEASGPGPRGKRPAVLIHGQTMPASANVLEWD